MTSTDGPEAPPSSEFYLDQALKTFERALDLADPDERPDLHGAILHDIAEVYEATGRIVESLDFFRRALVSKRRGATAGDLLITLLMLGLRLADRAEFAEARSLAEEANDALARAGAEMSPSLRAGRAYSLGLLHEQLGDAGEEGAHRLALEGFTLASTLYDEQVEAGACAGALRAMARLQIVVGRDEEAAESYTRAARCYGTDGDRDGQAVVLIDLGRLYQRLAEQSASRTVLPAPRPPADDAPGELPARPVDPFDAVDNPADDDVPDVRTALGLADPGTH